MAIKLLDEKKSLLPTGGGIQGGHIAGKKDLSLTKRPSHLSLFFKS